jgi:ABC-2 type transport system permease protein
MLKNSVAVAWKDLQVLFKDRGHLAVLFLMPLMFAAIFGQVYGGGSPGLSVYLVNQDTGRYGTQVANIFNQIDVLRIEELATAQEADEKIAAGGSALAAIVIPGDFSQRIEDFDPLNAPARVQVIVDPTQERFGSIVTGIVNEVMTWVIFQGEIQHGLRVVMDESGAFEDVDAATRKSYETQSLMTIMAQMQKATVDPLVAVESVDLAGVEMVMPENPYSLSVTGYTVMFAFFIVGIIASTLLTEKEEGTLRRLLTSPLHRAAIILGKMLAYVVVVGLQVLVMLGVGNLVYDIPLGSSPLGLVVLTLALALSATSLGMLVAALARTRSQADNIGVVLALVMAAVGGSIMPIAKGGTLYWVSRFTPHAHALEGYNELMLYEGGLADVLPQVGLLIGVAALFFLIAIRRFKFE